MSGERTKAFQASPQFDCLGELLDLAKAANGDEGRLATILYATFFLGKGHNPENILEIARGNGLQRDPKSRHVQLVPSQATSVQ
jgi:hypothetical protein